MCGRFASTIPPELVAKLFATSNAVPNLGSNWNTAPTQQALVVRRHPETAERHLDALKWGLLPAWTKDPDHARRPINARAETVAQLPTFRGAFAKRRAIVVMEAFYEWRRPEKQPKQPFAIARADGSPLALAGLWEGFKEASGEIIRTFCLLTTSSNELMGTVHDRMPVVLQPADWPLWLGETEGDPATLLRSADEDVLKLWPISTAVNAVRNNGPELLAPLQAPDAPPPSGAPAGANPA
ncbi:SOS response-associated peptidase (plasmid) [Lichenicola cladoniae]|uniref:Abasic site processing protein n=1 Tax=Lichenicola cladoniae TaxID=1484109 RepID=A0A6M8HXP5_9PROT|nr:SOS response-associated peptidase [Lichenicola cladoniae]NPD66304.1 SOS response-associated peptidase [Acetobacteraceae bacterium]QKE93162.1 SOS response-associated peptidase [Lichenicola cladoniae]